MAAAGAVVGVAGGASGSPLGIAGLHLSMCPLHACSGLGTPECHSGGSSGSSHHHMSHGSCSHSPCTPAGGPPMVVAPHNAPQTHSHGVDSPPHVVDLGGEHVVERCQGVVGTDLDGDASESLGEMGSLTGVACVCWVEGVKCWVVAHDGGGRECWEAVTCWSGGDEVGEWEVAGGVPFQCGGGGGDEVADHVGGEMMMMIVDGGVVDAACVAAGDLCEAVEEVDDVLEVGCVGEAAVDVVAHPVGDHVGAAVQSHGAAGQRADVTHPAGTLGLCLGGVGAQ